MKFGDLLYFERLTMPADFNSDLCSPHCEALIG